MTLQVINAAQVRALLPMTQCIQLMASAMAAASTGTIDTPPRSRYPLDNQKDTLMFMPSLSRELGVLGSKQITLFPDNPSKGLAAVQGLITLFDYTTGAALAVIDAAEITTIRTAAMSGLATQLLAREEASTCGIFGTGVQALSHIQAICAVRPLQKILMWGRDFAKAEAFVAEHAHHIDCPIQASQDPSEVAACDVICTVTGSSTPIVKGDWVKPGAHINLVGAHSLTTREADSALIASSALYVDSLVSAKNEAGDVMIPITEQVISEGHIIGEVGELVLGQIAGRCDSQQITVFKSLGMAAQDLFAAHYVYTAVLELLSLK